MIALDTNILIRLATQDDPRQLAAVVRFLEAHPDETFFVTDLVFTEFAWTLLRLYRWPRPSVERALRFLIEKPDLVPEERGRLLAAVRAFAEGGDFADTLLVARARDEGCSALLTLDAGLTRRHPRFAVAPDRG